MDFNHKMTLTAGRGFSLRNANGVVFITFITFTFFHLFFYYNLGLVGPCASARTSSRVAGARTNREIVLIEAQGRKAQLRCAAAQILWELEKWRQKPAQEDSRAFQRLSHCWQAPGGGGYVSNLCHTRVCKRRWSITSSSRVTTFVPTSFNSSSPCCSFWFVVSVFPFLFWPCFFLFELSWLRSSPPPERLSWT